MRVRNREIGFPPSNLEQLIGARLRGVRPEYIETLPPPGSAEDPADIFVDLAEMDEAWRANLQVASTPLLYRWVMDFRPADTDGVQALGELCYLVARIGNTAALPHLQVLLNRTDTTGLVHPGEDLRLRALRALVGLLGIAEPGQANNYKPVLLDALREPRLALTALVGLIGLWPADTDTYLQNLPQAMEHGELLEPGISLVFPPKNPLH